MNFLASGNPPVLTATGGLVRRVSAWMRRAPPEGRAEAVSALARAYLVSPLSEGERGEAILALTGALDDSSSIVRRALAEAFASAAQAPRHIMIALAHDHSDIARIVLARSPALTDAELVDCVATSDSPCQIAIARRPALRAGPAAALAELGDAAAGVALAANLDADLDGYALRRLFERFAEDGRVREAMLTRPDLPASLRADIAAETAKALAAFASDCQWLAPRRAERIAREAREQAIAVIAAESGAADLSRLVAHLRASGALTIALLLRSLMSGDFGLFGRALAELSGLPDKRTASFLADPRGGGFAAAYLKAGLPAPFLPAIRAALIELREGAPKADQMSHTLVMRTIRACEKLRDPALAPVLSLLWSFAGESAREEARLFTDDEAFSFDAPAQPALALTIEAEAVGDFAPSVEIDYADAPMAAAA